MKQQQEKVNIHYIAGYVRSGSTIMDILLGNMPGHFSLGELSFLPTNGLRDNEFCSCGSRVQECEFWKPISLEWEQQRTLSLSDYNSYYKGLMGNKNAIKLFYKLSFPDKQFNIFLEDTALLYRVIQKHLPGQVLIESSKLPFRILLLKRMGFDVKIIHLVRRLSGVLDSTKKTIEKNPELGVEKDLEPRGTAFVIFTWLFTNIQVVLFSKGVQRKKVTYEQLIGQPELALGLINKLDLEYLEKVMANGPFRAPHVVAGGRIRMVKNIMLKRDSKEAGTFKPGFFTGMVVRAIEKISW